MVSNKTVATPFQEMASGVVEKNLEDRIVTLHSGPRPTYYGGADDTYEVFKVLEAWGLDKDFYLGNVIKYLARAGKKCPTKYREDLQKALVYLEQRINCVDNK
jgi:hypothetical protein